MWENDTFLHGTVLLTLLMSGSHLKLNAMTPITVSTSPVNGCISVMAFFCFILKNIMPRPHFSNGISIIDPLFANPLKYLPLFAIDL